MLRLLGSTILPQVMNPRAEKGIHEIVAAADGVELAPDGSGFFAGENTVITEIGRFAELFPVFQLLSCHKNN